jgi:hypothetical protein
VSCDSLIFDATSVSEGPAQTLASVDDVRERLGKASPLQTDANFGPVDLRLACDYPQRH